MAADLIHLPTQWGSYFPTYIPFNEQPIMTISELPWDRIIDDNDVMRESLVFLLEEEDGWIVKAYRDAEEF